MTTNEKLREEFYGKFTEVYKLLSPENPDIKYQYLVENISREVADWWLSKLDQARQEEREKLAGEIIGRIGAKLLARHSPQNVLDVYFDVANEELEELGIEK